MIFSTAPGNMAAMAPSALPVRHASCGFSPRRSEARRDPLRRIVRSPLRACGGTIRLSERRCDPHQQVPSSVSARRGIQSEEGMLPGEAARRAPGYVWLHVGSVSRHLLQASGVLRDMPSCRLSARKIGHDAVEAKKREKAGVAEQESRTHLQPERNGTALRRRYGLALVTLNVVTTAA